MPTLSDVARAAGVSLATASRALNGTYRKNVSEATRRRIIQTARSMGYQPSVAARALRNKITYQYGLIVPDVARSVIPDVVQGLQSLSMEMGYSCLLYVTDYNPELEVKFFKLPAVQHLDGVIWLPTLGDAVLPEAQSILKRMHAVQILYRAPVAGVPAVLVDQERGGYLATHHLLELGHRRLACLCVDDAHGRQRLAGYHRALREAAIAVDPSRVVTTDYDWDAARAITRSLLQCPDPPTAIVAASDLVAWGAIRAVREAGLRVPDDLSVVGFDDMPVADYIDVPLTTIRQPKREVGVRALTLLRDLIQGGDAADVLLPPELVLRGSTGAPTRE